MLKKIVLPLIQKLFFRNNQKIRGSLNIKRNTSKKKKLITKTNKLNQRLELRSISSSLIIFLGFISLSFTIFFLIKQLNPLIKNERLKYLCTYQIGNKKNEKYNKEKIELAKIVGDSNKFCKNFIFPKDKSNSRFNFLPFAKDIFFRVIF